MNNIISQSQILELDKVLSLLTKYTSIPDAAEECLHIIPTSKMFGVETSLSQTNDAYMLIARFGSPSFGGAENVNNSLERSKMNGVLTMGELLKIARLLQVIRIVKDWKEHSAEASVTSLDGFFTTLTPNKFLEETIFSSILSEDEMSDTASQKLADIRRKIRQSSLSIREKLDKIIRSQSNSKYLQDAIVTQRDGRFVVPVKQEYRSEVPGLIHDTSSSGATLFIEPMAVVEVNNELRVLRAKEKDEIERILSEISASVAEYADGIKLSYSSLVKLDVIFAKAKFAYDTKSILPKINREGRVVLRNARHPLLFSKAVPISLSLGVDFDTLVITGPNTGGKTVTLKTIGLLTLMTMCGFMIPADDGSEINIFDNVFADIGDKQSIEQSLSTFSSHMTNIVDILNGSCENTLVLLDELCAGTDPVEGAALAKSIIEELRLSGANVVTTTHYAELKAFALDTDGVENACCEFSVETLKPTYRLLIGVPGKSNAFSISQRLGISAHIIERAGNMVSEDNKRFEAIVTSLEKARENAENERISAENIRKELAELKKSNQEKLKEFEAERKRIIEKANSDAERIVDNARYQTDKLMSEIEDLKKQINRTNASETLKKAKETAKSTISKLENEVIATENYKESYKLPRDLRLGDLVLLRDIDKKATVKTLPDKNGDLTVTAGIISIKTNVSNLKLIENQVTVNGKKQPQRRNVTGIPSRLDTKPATELDIRGMASDEAILELDKFIDDALISGIEIIRIIHGKGTGILKKSVQQHLKTHKNIRTYRLGVFGEGEDGVTIAELK